MADLWPAAQTVVAILSLIVAIYAVVRARRAEAATVTITQRITTIENRVQMTSAAGGGGGGGGGGPFGGAGGVGGSVYVSPPTDNR